MTAVPGTAGSGHRSGFVALLGRPNAGKSTLLNRILGQRVSIVSDRPQTTRNRVRGVITRPDAQVVFVDTPGMHKPRTMLGRYLNAEAADTAHDVDVVCLVVDAAAPFGRGDAFIVSRLPADSVAVVTKSDLVSPATMLKQLAAVSAFDFESYFPVSGATGRGVDTLVDHLVGRLPEGPRLYPPDTVSDVSEAFRVAELVREQLLRTAHEELPYSIATRVVQWDWPLIRCEIIVERESQKPMVIGRGGSVLKAVGQAVRAQLADGAYLDLVVKVSKDWQRRPEALRRLGFRPGASPVDWGVRVGLFRLPGYSVAIGVQSGCGFRVEVLGSGRRPFGLW